MVANTNEISAEAKARYTGGLFNPIVEKCEGCERIVSVDDKNFCHTYISPDAKWKLGICNFATHVKPEIITSKIKVNPLKASKRAMGKK